MFRQLIDIFNNVTNNNEIIVTDNNKIVEENMVGSDIIDHDQLIGSISLIEPIKTVPCNHCWVDYDEYSLDNINIISEVRKENNLIRILNKFLTDRSDLLDHKMLTLITSWLPPSHKVLGKCMSCDADITIIGFNHNNKYQHLMLCD